MNKQVYEQLGLRYKKFIKYVSIIFCVSIVLFFIFSALNTGNQVLNILTIACLTVAMATFVEIPTLFILSRYMLRKAKK